VEGLNSWMTPEEANEMRHLYTSREGVLE
jgi:hypothetical protein